MLEKKKISRRDFLRVSGVAAASGVLAACGAEATPEEEVKEEMPAEEAEEEQPEAPAEEPEEVSIFFWDGPPLIGIREEAMQPFDEAYPGCKMNFTSNPGGPAGGYNDKLFTMLAAGDAPDVFIIEYTELAGLLSKDQLLDLKPMIEADGYDLSQFPEMMIEAYTHEGGIYGLPDNLAAIAIFYNQDMFEEAGAMLPTDKWDDEGWTVDDFFNSCEKLTKTDASGKTTQWGYDVTTWDKVWQTWVRIFGGQMVDDPFYPTECTLNEKEAVEGLQFLFDLRWEYGFAPKPEAMADMGSTELLLSGKLGMLNNGSWAFNNFRDTDFTVSLGHYPTGPGGRSNYVYYYPLVVPKTTESPQCAFNMMKYFEGPAMEKIIKDGGLQGTTFDAQEKWFETDPVQPNPKYVFTDAVKHFLAPDPILTNWNEILNVMQAQLDLLNIGEERDAKVVCDEIVRQVNPLIAEGQWRTQ